MTIRKDTHEVFYINFSLEEKLQNQPNGSQGIALSFQRPIKPDSLTSVTINLRFVSKKRYRTF